MQKKFLSSLFFLLLLNLLIKPIWLLGIDRGVQNLAGTEAYGIYYVLLNFSFLLNILLDPGIISYNNRNIAQNNLLLPKYLPQLLTIKLMLGIGYFLVTLGVALLMGYSGFKLHLLAFLAFNQVLASMVLYLRSNISALHRFTADSILSVADRALMILFGGILLWSPLAENGFRIEWFVYMQTVAYLLTVIAAFYLNRVKFNFGKLKINWPFFMAIIRQSYPYALLAILMTLYSRVDAVMLERLLPDGVMAAGIYAAAYRILDAFNILALLFATLLLPIFSRMLKQKEDVRTLVSLSWPLLQVPVVIVVAAVFTYRHQIMDALYVGTPAQHGDVLGILIFTFVAMGNVYIFGTLLTATGKLRILNIIATAGMVLNVAMNFYLIPIYGILGAVFSTLATQYLVGFSHIFLSYKIFSMGYTFSLAARGLLFLAGLVVSFYFLHGTWDNWLLNMVILTIINLIFALVLRIINVHQIIKSFK